MRLSRPAFDARAHDFTYVLHLAVYQVGGLDYDTALRTNAEGTGLLMSHCRNAKAFLHMSTCSVYKPDPDPYHVYTETDPLGDNESPVLADVLDLEDRGRRRRAHVCAGFDLPTTIARMEVSYGANGGWPAYMFDGMRAGQAIPLQAPGPNLHGPIHEDDICEQAGALLDAASTPAVVVNWAGDDIVSAEDWCTYMGELTGRDRARRCRRDARHAAGFHRRPHEPAGDHGSVPSRLARRPACRYAARYP